MAQRLLGAQPGNRMTHTMQATTRVSVGCSASFFSPSKQKPLRETDWTDRTRNKQMGLLLLIISAFKKQSPESSNQTLQANILSVFQTNYACQLAQFNFFATAFKQFKDNTEADMPILNDAQIHALKQGNTGKLTKKYINKALLQEFDFSEVASSPARPGQ